LRVPPLKYPAVKPDMPRRHDRGKRRRYKYGKLLCLYDKVEIESGPEREFVEGLEKIQQVRMYIKLPSWFTVPTPVGEFAEPLMDAQTVEDRDRSQTIRIPQTEWLKILEGLRYGKYTVFEIETPPPPMEGVLAEAVDNLAQARRLFEEGNYEDSMVRSRRAIEAAVDKVEAKSGRRLAEIMRSDSRAEFVRALASKTNVFLGPAAHSTTEPRVPERRTREDARLAILMAYGSVAYVASFLSKNSLP
jgi:HEPN domain-containing protein